MSTVKKRLATWVSVIGVIALATLAGAASPFPSLAARVWAVGGDPKQADVIVVLGGGTTWPGVMLCNSVNRLQHGVWLYQRGYAPKVILSGGGNPRQPLVPAAAELMRRAAVALGVPAEDILVEDRSTRTYENGTEVAALMQNRGWRSALVVTDAVHMRRAGLVFRRLGIDVHPSPSHTVGLGWATPGQGLVLLEELTHEVVGLAVYRWRGWV